MIKEQYIGLKDSEFIPLTEGIPKEAINLFEINKLGEVRRVSDNLVLSVLNYSHSHGDGYPRVCLPVSGRRFTKLIHRLVAENFLVPGSSDQVIVDHIDRDIKNYHVSNLRWVSVSDNMKNRSFKKKDNIVYREVDLKSGSVIREVNRSTLTKKDISNFDSKVWRARTRGSHKTRWEKVDTNLEEFYKKYGKPVCWKSVKRLKNETYISNNGLIKYKSPSGKGFITTPGHLLSSNYMGFNSGGKCYRVHRLVYETFSNNGNPIDSSLEIDHINTDSLDNRIENLSLCTHKVNMNNELTRKKLGKCVEKYDIFGKLIKTYDNISSTSYDLGLSKPSSTSHISESCKGKIISYVGFLWIYSGEKDVLRDKLENIIYVVDTNFNILELSKRCITKQITVGLSTSKIYELNEKVYIKGFDNLLKYLHENNRNIS